MKNHAFLIIYFLVAAAYLCSFAGGDGTEQNPYQVSNVYELQEIENYLGANFIQVNDIDAGETRNWNNGEGFFPIGDYYPTGCPFMGVFDGNDYVIDSLYINRPDSNYVGLFGAGFGPTIMNVHLANMDITGLSPGGLVDVAYNCEILNCSCSGEISGSGGSGGGGLIGCTGWYSLVTACVSAAEVTGQFRVGGFIGGNYDGSIIDNCYSTGSVDGNDSVGGFAGAVYDASILNCYSVGFVAGNTNVGGLIGANNSSEVTNSFWDIQTSGLGSSAGGTGKITAEMKMVSTFLDAGWDFVGEISNGLADYWLLVPESYPYLSWEKNPPVITAIEDIPYDQGHLIELLWDKTDIDTQISGYCYYSIWRRRDEVFDDHSTGLDTPIANKTRHLDSYVRNDSWSLLLSVPATTSENYSHVLPTLIDSTSILSPSEYGSTFKVVYHYGDMSYSSIPFSGYSVDNIAPYAATGVTLAFNATRNTSARKSSGRARTEFATLSWNEVNEGGYNGNSYPEQNGVWYRVYAGDTPDFPCDGSTLLGTTQDTSYEITPMDSVQKFFKVVVSDQP